MKLSRKPKVLIIMFVMAMFLLTQAGLAAAAPAINWGNWLTDQAYTTGTITGHVYDTVPESIYATVYASINGISSSSNPVVTSGYVYGDSSQGAYFSIPVANFSGLTVGTSYSVNLAVYSGPTSPVDVAGAGYTIKSANFLLGSGYIGGSSGSNSGSGGNTIPLTSNNVTATNGGTVSSSGITVVIPANALLADIQVTIAKITNLTGLPVDAATKLVSDVFEITKDKLGDFSKPVTLTLNFDKSQVDTTKFDLFVCYLDEVTNKWVKLDNVKVDMVNGTVSGDTLHFTKFAVIAFAKTVASAPTLSDVAGHWAAASINRLIALGAIKGYPDGTFKPNNNISRAEFVTVLVQAFKLAPATGKVFSDTANHWAKDYISAAAGAGIVAGYSATTFGPNDPITREQMAVMIVQAAKLATAQAGNTFTDSAKISAWAKAAVDSASKNKIIVGNPDNSFKPQGLATRAEAVTVIANALK